MQNEAAGLAMRMTDRATDWDQPDGGAEAGDNDNLKLVAACSDGI